MRACQGMRENCLTAQGAQGKPRRVTLMSQGIARAWFIANTQCAQRAAIDEWARLRAEESTRTVASQTAQDATERAAEHGLRMGSALSDHPSRVLSIASPHVGTVTAQDGAEWASVDAWGYVAEHAMSTAFMARVMHIMTSEAREHGRNVDWSKTDDVASEARATFVRMVTEWSARADVYTIRDASSPDNVGGVAEWGIPRDMRCNACEGCQDAPETAARASRYNVKGCAAPVTRIDWVTPSRALSRAIWRTASDASLATSAVYATRSTFLARMAEGIAEEERTNSDVMATRDPLAGVPEAAASLIRLIAATCAITGDDVVYARNGGLSPAARTILTMAIGTADTKKGAENGLKRARALWVRTSPIGPTCGARCAHATCLAIRRAARIVAEDAVPVSA